MLFTKSTKSTIHQTACGKFAFCAMLSFKTSRLKRFHSKSQEDTIIDQWQQRWLRLFQVDDLFEAHLEKMVRVPQNPNKIQTKSRVALLEDESFIMNGNAIWIRMCLSLFIFSDYNCWYYQFDFILLFDFIAITMQIGWEFQHVRLVAVPCNRHFWAGLHNSQMIILLLFCLFWYAACVSTRLRVKQPLEPSGCSKLKINTIKRFGRQGVRNEKRLPENFGISKNGRRIYGSCVNFWWKPPNSLIIKETYSELSELISIFSLIFKPKSR